MPDTTHSLIRIDDEYLEAIWKLKGEVTITTQTVISHDGDAQKVEHFTVQDVRPAE